ncbi:carotenoid isomerooxygenase-like isoform X2 [Chironomus tepperi]|uniref:carotenoid isomerooxygenase-like isoform X2 n=1 Tax=Chironomus tepperi TaxID=113505 RepID=UPI00391FA9A4
MLTIFVDDEADFPIRLVSDIIDDIFLASGSIKKIINDDDEIEIIDLDDDDDERYKNCSRSHSPILLKQNYYPNCDVNVWLRSCEQEIIEPINGTLSGSIPSWINGCLLRNGPGSLKVGSMTFNHLFDSSALLHRFNVENGNVTYQCRFLKTDSYKKNWAANRVVVSEFGTACAPDPCQSIFQRVATLFKPADANSDNAMISIYPFNDEYFAFAESPVIHKIDIDTLDTIERMNLHERIGIVNHTSHPHVMNDGSVYNVGLTITKSGPAYGVLHFPKGERIFDDAKIVAEIPTRWKLHPSYMHTFGITENYFIIVEQPLTVSVPSIIKSQLTNEPMITCLKWFPDKPTLIYLVDRSTGELRHTYQTEAFFFLHIINQYEKDDHVVLDISCYKDPEMLNCMYIDSMKKMQSNPDYARLFRGRPLRFVLPLKYPPKTKSLSNFFTWNCDAETFNTFDNNLVKLKNSSASAFSLPDGSVFCKPELLCNLGCETPRIHYEKYLGMDYQYFYAISSDVDADIPGTLIKVDVYNKTKITWGEKNVYPSEPIFVPCPNPQTEDDGVILASMVWGEGDENHVGLLVLDAKNMTELGRCEFKDLPGPVPKCLHGWFAARKN